MNDLQPIKAKDARSVNGYVYIRFLGELRRVVMLTPHSNGTCTLNIEGASYVVADNHTLWYQEDRDNA